MIALQGCQSLDAQRAAPGKDAATAAGPAPAEGYPRLNTVPRRPQLSYPVEQRRAIVQGLASDRANARYTNQLIRYRSGQTTLPPPPAPAAPGLDPATVVADVGPARALPEPSPAQAFDDQRMADDGARTLGTEDAELDDGSLNDFIREMVRDSAPQPPAGAEPAPPVSAAPEEREATRPPAAPGRTQGPVQRLFGWLGGLFTGGGAAAAAGAPPAAAEPPAQAPEAEAPAPQAAAPAAAIMPAAAIAGPNAAPALAVTPPARRAAAAPRGLARPGDVLAVLQFGAGSAALPQDATPLLRRALMGAGAGAIRIVGEGGEPALALDRARTVALALVRLGARPGRLELAADPAGARDQARLVAGPPPE